MGATQDRPQIPRDSDTGLAKRLRQKQHEPLTRAKDTLKGRMLQQITQQALEEMQDTEQVVNKAFEKLADAEEVKAATEALKERLLQQIMHQVLEELHDTEQVVDEAAERLAEEEVLKATKDSLKERLLDQVRQQVLDEVSDTEQVVDEAVEDLAENETVQGVKETLRAHLFDRLFQEAVEEISDEVNVAPEPVTAPSVEGDASRLEEQNEAEAAPSEPESIAHPPAHHPDAPPDGSAPDAPETASELPEEEQQAVAEMADLIDMHFWEGEDSDGEAFSLPAEAEETPEEEAQEEESGGFLLSNAPEADGSVFDDAWSDEEGGALTDHGDGIWQPFEVEALPAEAPSPFEEPPPESFEDGPEAPPEEETEEETEEVAYYVYGIRVGEDRASEEVLPEEGIDGRYPVFSVSHQDLDVFVSKVPLEDFGEGALEAHLQVPEWQEPHERIHHALTAHLALGGAFAPMPFATVRADLDQVHEMMQEISTAYLDSVKALQGRTAWTVKLYRDREALRQQVVETSKTVQGLMADIKRKPKGGTQSIKKKMVATINEEVALLSDSCAQESHETLRFIADDVEIGEPVTEGRKEEAEMILHNTYLVLEERTQGFKDKLQDLNHDFETLGFRFDVTGPLTPNMFLKHSPLEESE